MRQEKLFYLGVKALIRNPSGSVLLLSSKRSNGEEFFDLPGGRINRGETPLEALTREIQEETGISDVEIGRHLGMAQTEVAIPITSTETGGLVLSVYACLVPDITTLIPEEGVTLDWYQPGAVTKKLSNYPIVLRSAIDDELKKEEHATL